MKIPPPKQTAKVYIKEVRVDKKRMIMTFHETDTSITIYIGNATIYCIDAQLLKKADGSLYDQGHLTKIRYDKVCSLDDDFEKGTDSVMILKLLLTYISNTYPTIQSMTFKDMSTKECDDGSHINLAVLKYLTGGKTWYEERFGAGIDESSAMFYKNLEDRILEKKKNTTWSQLKIVVPIQNIPIDEKELQEIYERASSWQEFFNPIVEKLGKIKSCIVFSPWFENFVMGYLRIYFMSLMYTLPVKDHGISYTIVTTKGGSRKKPKTNQSKSPS